MIRMLEREREFETGEKVVVLLATTTNKLLAQWQGPCRVLHRVGEVICEVDMPDKRKRKTNDLPCEHVEEVAPARSYLYVGS